MDSVVCEAFPLQDAPDTLDVLPNEADVCRKDQNPSQATYLMSLPLFRDTRAGGSQTSPVLPVD